HDEKIDVIEWNPDPAIFIAKAISPARVSGVYLTDQRSSSGKTATVVVPEDQLSLAIGRVGQNARLAAKLTGWRIDIKSLPEAAVDALNKLKNDASLSLLRESEKESATKIEEMLAKKADGRPLNPEEYDQMARFVDRVERKVIAKTEQQHKEEEEKLAAIRNSIPATAFETSILDGSLPEHVAYTLQEAGYFSIGDMALQFKQNPDVIKQLHGIGEKAMESITLVIAELDKKMAAEQAVVEIVAETPVESVEEVEVPVEAVSTEEVQVLTPEEVEQVIDVITAGTGPEVEEAEETPEREPSLEELFTLRPEVLDTAGITEDEDEENGKTKKKGKKKGKSVVVTYDPDRDMTLVQKKHKRGGDGWDWDE
ncbi:MAG TPA: hypothetical protein PK883_05275, partial [Anaerolineaceae bacterium]|nr:hypothetical protein [Anaerolineaceae bacterium]